jgi:hypothetical protein
MTTNNKITIYLGDIYPDTCEQARQYDASAYLVDHSNYKNFLNSIFDHDTTVYTSIADLPNNDEVILNVLQKANTIVYVPPTTWSDNKIVDIVDPTSSTQGHTETMLLKLSDQIKIVGLDLILLKQDVIPLVDSRKSDSPQLWSVGCSITHGTGVEPLTRYGSLLSSDLAMPCSFLTRPGSSIGWAADQILRSDIKEHDIVVWGITSNERLMYVHDKKLLKGVTHSQYIELPGLEKIIPFKNLISENTFYQNILSVQQVVNFCNKINCKLLLLGLFDNHNLTRFLKTLPNYHKFPYRTVYNKYIMHNEYVDLGTDQSHPGPAQHIEYKKFILNLLEHNYYA